MSTEADLAALYPFLHGGRQEKASLQAALLASVAEKARDTRDTGARFFADQAPSLVAAAQALAGAYRGGGRLFTMGNGGSSCDAAHIAVEFNHPVTAGRPALPAIDLAADPAILTALGNDVGFDRVFSRQLVSHARAGDALVGVSTSGNSANLIEAFMTARQLGMVTVGLTGGDGGRMRSCGAVDHCLVVPSQSIHRIQETHVAAYHILWDLVHALLADDRGAARGHGEAA